MGKNKVLAEKSNKELSREREILKERDMNGYPRLD